MRLLSTFVTGHRLLGPGSWLTNTSRKGKLWGGFAFFNVKEALGNGDVIVTLSFPNATGTTTCTNPGGNQAAGQNPATPAATSGRVLIDNPKNGTLSFTVTTSPPANPSPQAAGCPNGNWTAAFDNITFGAGTLTIQQETFQGSGVYQTVLTTNVFLS